MLEAAEASVVTEVAEEMGKAETDRPAAIEVEAAEAVEEEEIAVVSADVAEEEEGVEEEEEEVAAEGVAVEAEAEAEVAAVMAVTRVAKAEARVDTNKTEHKIYSATSEGQRCNVIGTPVAPRYCVCDL